jgi:hypothetical protein
MSLNIGDKNEEVNEGKEEVNEGKEEVNEGKEEHENKSKDPISNNMKCVTSIAGTLSRLPDMRKTYYDAIKSIQTLSLMENLTIFDASENSRVAYIEAAVKVSDLLKNRRATIMYDLIENLKVPLLPQLNYSLPQLNIYPEFYQNPFDWKEPATISLVDSNETPKEKNEEIHPFQRLMQNIEEINTKLGEIAETQRGILEEIKKINIT